MHRGSGLLRHRSYIGLTHDYAVPGLLHSIEYERQRVHTPAAKGLLGSASDKKPPVVVSILQQEVIFVCYLEEGPFEFSHAITVL